MPVAPTLLKKEKTGLVADLISAIINVSVPETFVAYSTKPQ